MQAISGAPYTLTFDFKQDGEYVVPDDASVNYTIYANDGSVLHSDTVDTDNNTNQVQLPISGTYQTVADGLQFEQRTVRLAYTVGGNSFLSEQWYYVTGLLNYRVTPGAVVALLGIKEGEVLFDEIDLVGAYFNVADSLGLSVLTAALASGGIKQIKTNEAIKITAALDLARIIELKAFKKFGNELSYTRFDNIDFDAIRSGLLDALSDALAVSSDVVLTAPTLFTVTNPVNVLTG